MFQLLALRLHAMGPLNTHTSRFRNSFFFFPSGDYCTKLSIILRLDAYYHFITLVAFYCCRLQNSTALWTRWLRMWMCAGSVVFFNVSCCCASWGAASLTKLVLFYFNQKWVWLLWTDAMHQHTWREFNLTNRTVTETGDRRGQWGEEKKPQKSLSSSFGCRKKK